MLCTSGFVDDVRLCFHIMVPVTACRYHGLLLRGIGYIMSWTTASAKTERVVRVRDAGTADRSMRCTAVITVFVCFFNCRVCL